MQAWNAADSLLLEAVAALDNISNQAILTVNDEHGALSVPLAGCSIWTDSRLSELAITNNAARNQVALGPLVRTDALNPRACVIALLRIPKQLALLRWQLQYLRENMPPNAIVICAGMDKHLPRSCASILEQYLGPTEREPGSRKARLFRTRVDPELTATEPPYQRYSIPNLPQPLLAGVNVFSREKLDIGTRLLLEQAPHWPASDTVVDLGCGNGVLGVVAACKLRPAPARIVFVDESALALHSAQANVEQQCDRNIQVDYLHSDGLLDYPADWPAPRLVLCNPPFHQGHVVDDWIGQRLISQCAKTLVAGGELWLVANRHLPYGANLARQFASVEQVVQNSKFIIYRAVAKA